MSQDLAIIITLILTFLIGVAYAIIVIIKPPYDNGRWHQNTWFYVAIGVTITAVSFGIIELLIAGSLHWFYWGCVLFALTGIPQIICQYLKRQIEGFLTKRVRDKLDRKLEEANGE